MKITYIGDGDHRIVTGADFPDIEDDFVYEWTPGSWCEVRDDVGKELLERSRHHFVLYEDPKGRDHRTYDELMEEARELDISGRSKMDKEELRDAIYSRRADSEGESGATGETETPSEAPEEGEETPEDEGPVIAQSDTPDRV